MNLSLTMRWLAVIALSPITLFMLWLLFQGARSDEGAAQITTHLRQAKQHLSELGQQLVLTRHDLLPHYDSINAGMAALKADISALQADESAQRTPALKTEIGHLEALYQDQARQIEDFKSTNAVLKNSLRYFPLAVTQLNDSMLASGQRMLARRVADLGSEVLVFNLTANPELDARIRHDTDALGLALSPTGWREPGSRLRQHARTILDYKMRLDAQTFRLLAFPIRTTVDKIEAAYLSNQRIEAERQNHYRNALMLYASLLLGLLAYFGYRYKLQIDQFKQQATHDSLTGLSNRAQLHSEISRLIEHAERGDKGFALILLDLDRFKEINDTLGHQSGDQLLKEIGPRIQSRLPKDACIARLGGDEFAVLLPRVNLAAASMAHAVALRTALSQPFTLGTLMVEISASMGIVHYPEHGANGNELLRHADIAMYAAKIGEGCLHYASELDVHSTRRLTMMTDLGRAIREGQLDLLYQPKVDIRTGKVLGVEALLRWDHPQLGPISPAEFVPLAEMSDTIHPLTRWVIEMAACQIRVWEKNGFTLNVAVNLSARNLLDDSLPQHIQQILDACGVPPERMEMEITESAIMADPRRADQVLHQINQMGIKLALDDFGTGYSSLAYLLRLPVACIKLDRAFVANLWQKGEAAIVRSTVQMAHNLGLSMVAEGAEDVATVAALMRADYDVVQGYYFSRPLSAEALQEWLLSGRPAALFEAARQASLTAQDLPAHVQASALRPRCFQPITPQFEQFRTG
ncbi:MAG: EAL domain-containing protein [Thiobacillus sp.]|nr:EAL domain-containing protein [Thiobacillus sp.]